MYKNRQLMRLNNVFHKGVIKQVDCIAAGHVSFIEDIPKTNGAKKYGEWVDLDEVEFIPITEERLLGLGFYTHGKYKWHGNGYDYQPKDHWQERTDYILNDNFFIAIKEDYFNYKLDSRSMIIHNTEWYEKCTENAIYAPIEYVHQLQNLYWCLCGEELELIPCN